MTELKLILEFGEYNGCMLVECYANGTLISLFDSLTSSQDVEINAKVDFPFELTVKVSGKNSDTDTMVEDGKVIKDKYVKLKEIYLSRFKINESVLHNMCQFTPQNKESEKTNYFYCNGVATLNFQAKDVLRWHLMHNKY